MRDVIAGVDRGDAACSLAFSVYVHRLRREVAAMVAALGGLDVLAFTGGIGEHQPRVRAEAVEGLGYLGLHLDEGRNTDAPGDAEVTGEGATARTVVVSAREDVEIARQVRQVLNG